MPNDKLLIFIVMDHSVLSDTNNQGMVRNGME